MNFCHVSDPQWCLMDRLRDDRLNLGVIVNGIGVEEVKWQGFVLHDRSHACSLGSFLKNTALTSIHAPCFDTIMLDIDDTNDVLRRLKREHDKD